MLRLPSVYTILPGVNFAKALAQAVWDEYRVDLKALSDVQIYLPNRRSCRAMANMFLQVSDGQATLLPRMTPIGDIDEEDLFEIDPFIVQEDPFITPAIPPMERQLILTQLILARPDQILSTTEAFRLAGELAKFLDRAHVENVDLKKIDTLVTGDLAEHWQKTSQFLSIIVHEWPQYLADNNLSDPAHRRNVIIQKKIDSLRRNPPMHRVIAAGSTGSIALTAQLLNVIARLPNGSVVLPGLDPDMPDAIWDSIDVQHPYYYQKHLVEQMEIDRRAVHIWPHSEDMDITALQKLARAEKRKLVEYALQPQEHFNLTDAVIDPVALQSTQFIAAETPFHEAKIISLALRDILDKPEQTALVITPDQQLARYIQQEMLRWNIVVNNSAGYDLTLSPVGNFLSLIAEFGLHPYPATHLLSLLRHPLMALNRNPTERGNEAIQLENIFREEFIPQSGLSDFAKQVSVPILDDFMAVMNAEILSGRQPLARWIERHIRLVEILATNEHRKGADVLWQGDAGEAAAQLLHQLYQSAQLQSVDLSAQDYLSFIYQAMRQVIVRPRFGQHPRIHILSPIEARLQDADHVFLAGMNEGIWPTLPNADPWLSRLMQNEMGFGSPDRRIGQSALDFATLFCAANITVSWSKNREGVISHASRWLQQIFAVLKKNEILPVFEASPYYHWAKSWDEPVRLKPTPAPSFAPPVADRPRNLYISDIETWQKDPYSLYAKRILKLRPADMLDNEPGAREWGDVAHSILEQFLKSNGLHSENPSNLFDIITNEVLSSYPLGLSQEKAWRTKLSFIRDEFIRQEKDNKGISETEITFSAIFPLADGTTFTLGGRADRIDTEGKAIRVSDYKTGTPPSERKIQKMLAPQLPLLGYLAQQNRTDTQDIQLQYIQLKGKASEPLKTKQFKDSATLMAINVGSFQKLLATYYSAPVSYTAQLMHQHDFDDYKHLKRVAEWASLSEGDDDSDEGDES